MTLIVRPAGLADALAIARLHNAGWHEAYAELAPADMRADMTEEVRLLSWQTLLAQAGEATTLVGQAPAGLAGFVLLGLPSDIGMGGRCEVKHLFVDRSHQRQGVGRRLMAEAARLAAARGFRGLALGVVEGNSGGIAFYDALGGRRMGAYTDPGPRWRSRNLLFVWDELERLARGAHG